jgi:hypothetical protein
MTYSIDVRPYNDPYIKTAEAAAAAAAEVIIPGAFLVDIIPILKYVPEWFPGAKFQSKAAALRKHAAMLCDAPFSATEKLIVCNTLPFIPNESLYVRYQATGEYDPSFVTESLRDIQHSATPKQDADLLKDVAATAYIG